MTSTEATIPAEDVAGTGQAFAYSYYYGFVKLLLADTAKGPGFQDRIRKFETDNNIQIKPHKFLLLVPTCPLLIASDFETLNPERIKRAGTLQTTFVSRAGIKERPYTTSVYSFKDKEGKDPVHVILDLPSILLTIYEMCGNGDVLPAEMQKELKSFSSKLQQLLENDPTCRDKFQILNFNGTENDLIEFIREEVKRS